jgi:cytochrome c peroxidase
MTQTRCRPANVRRAASARQGPGPARRAAAGLALAWLTALPGAVAAAQVEFDQAEIEKIVALGPWPPPVVHDASNRASGNVDAIELGRRLFTDARLSPVGYIACVTCHQPDRGWTDRKQRAHGLGDVDRNTQPLTNLAQQRWFGWGGASDTIWMASIRPILDPREIDSNPAHVRRVYVRVPEYACLYRRAFGVDPIDGGESDEAVLVRTAKALAAFTETLATGRTPFDAFRDAVARGQPPSATGYSPSAQRGLKIFVGLGNCVACHRGPNFSDGSFHDTGVPWFVAQRRADPGRREGIAKVQSSRFNRAGHYSDDAHPAGAAATRAVAPDENAGGAFRTPSLRNVADTAPYMHNGSLDTLRDVVGHYARVEPQRLRGDARHHLRRLALSAAQTDDLIAFLDSLSDERGENRMLPAPRPGPCDAAVPPAR